MISLEVSDTMFVMDFGIFWKILALLTNAIAKPMEWILAKYSQERAEKKEADRKLYKEIIEFIPYDFVHGFSSCLLLQRSCQRNDINKLYGYLNSFSERGDKIFLDKALQKKRLAMDTSLKELLTIISKRFFCERDIEYYDFCPGLKSKDENTYYKYLNELRSIAEKFENAHNKFIQCARKRLLI